MCVCALSKEHECQLAPPWARHDLGKARVCMATTQSRPFSSLALTPYIAKKKYLNVDPCAQGKVSPTVCRDPVAERVNTTCLRFVEEHHKGRGISPREQGFPSGLTGRRGEQVGPGSLQRHVPVRQGSRQQSSNRQGAHQSAASALKWRRMRRRTCV